MASSSNSRAGAALGQNSTNLSGNGTMGGGVRYESHPQAPQATSRVSLEGQTNPHMSHSTGFGKDAKREAFVLGAASSSGNGVNGTGVASGSSARYESRQSASYSRQSQSHMPAHAMAMAALPVTKSDSSREMVHSAPSKYDVSNNASAIHLFSIISTEFILALPSWTKLDRNSSRGSQHAA